MYFLGYTFNTMTMLGLLLLIGVVVDDAIVVLENIYRHAEEHGSGRKVAAASGTRQVVFARHYRPVFRGVCRGSDLWGVSVTFCITHADPNALFTLFEG